MSLKHLIIGCGDLGLRTARILTQSGHQVVGLRRSPEHLPAWLPGIKADILKLDRPSLLDGFHSIFLIVSARHNTYNIYPEAAKNLVHLLKQLPSPPQRLIYVSSTRVHPQNQGEWIDENSPIKATEYKSQALIAAETSIQEISQHIIVRLSGLYTRETLLKAYSRLKDVQEAPYRYTNRIHREDAARFLAYLTTLRPFESLYLCSDSMPVLQSTYLNWLSEQKGKHRTVQNSGQWPEGKRCSNKRIKASGFELMYPNFKTTYLKEKT